GEVSMTFTIRAWARLALVLLATGIFVSADASAKDRSDRENNKRVSRDAQDDDDDDDDEDEDEDEGEKDERRGKNRRKGEKQNASGSGRIVLPNLSASFATEEQRQLGLLLGKALYWDEQIGSGNGGNYACASCHYSAGADAQKDRIISGTIPAGKSTGPNTIRGSLGVRYAQFVALKMEEVSGQEVSAAVEIFTKPGDYLITDRNAPSAVDSNSIHNFWDGRANYVFNGVGTSGEPIPIPTKNGGFSILQIAEASQASQAVGPCLSPAEMSSDGRTFADIGYKIRHAIPLRNQSGNVVDELAEMGLRYPGGYGELIDAVFEGGPLDSFLSDEPTSITTPVQNTGGQIEDRLVSISELNFSIFFGVAVAVYEQSLVTIPAKYPTSKQIDAFEKMRCEKCHYVDGRSHAVIGDVGSTPFSATGVAPLRVDAGVEIDDLNLDAEVPNYDADPGEGQFKSTHLFNLPLTGPYFHDGSAETLEEMMDFYVRGGDFNQKNIHSHVRELDVSKKEYRLVLKLMKQLTDPRIEAGEPPFDHPSLTIPLHDGREVYLAPSDAGHGGLHYTVHSAGE
ncbi:MAG: cytochrome c peroxidase, partial [Planctomycetota bacterium]|nr:cytochrome c peroxidase [Planctomycetota bacterium]